MDYENGYKEKFFEMLKARQIIAVGYQKPTMRRNFIWKFIGANNDGRWDFTPMLVNFFNPKTQYNCVGTSVDIVYVDAPVALIEAIIRMADVPEEFDYHKTDYHSLYEKVRDLITTIYL